MRKYWKIITLILCASSIYLFYPKKAELPFLPFEVSMSKAFPAFPQWVAGDHNRHHQWALVKKLYEKFRTSTYSQKPRIPKIIHQIWIGGPFPEKYRAWQKSWQDKHPDWQYRLWTDADVATFPFINKKRFDLATNIGEKADIFRYEILYRYGGLYVDTDFECIQPFDLLHHTCDFYIGIEAATEKENILKIANGLIGTVPHHPILKFCIERIGQTDAGKTAGQVLKATGPGCMKRAFLRCCQKGSYRNVALPYTYFYPVPAHICDKNFNTTVKNQWVQPESYGIHYWETSWIDKN